MAQAILLAAVRTPIGRFHGNLATLSATELGARAVAAAVERSGVNVADVDEVVLGNVVSAGLGQAPARQAALGAGLPVQTPAVTINKVCGSGLKAVALAAAAIRGGEADVVVAGGMESMSRCPYLLRRSGPKLGHRESIDSLLHDGLVCPFTGRAMGEIADDLARAEGFTRESIDAYAAESHRRAVAASREGAFDAEIVPIVLPGGSITRDEGPRADATTDRLTGLPAAFGTGGIVTAGNSSMISDGAAALVVVEESAINGDAGRSLGRIAGIATVATDPEDLFIAPVEAIRRAVERSGHALDDVDLFELNEAFAVQMLACLDRLEVDPARVNVNGGAIALGHPIGASGARILTTLVHALRARRARVGVAAACLGGGEAIAIVVDAPESGR